MNKRRLITALVVLAIIGAFSIRKIEKEMYASLEVAYAESRDEPVVTQTIFVDEPYPVYVPVQTAVDVQPLGEFEVTYYTAGYESTGKRPGDKAYGVTKSGAIVDDNVTVAVDPTVIPLGTYLYIEGIGFRVAQDIGGAIKGNKIDIYVTTVKEAREKGRHPAKVYILGGK